MIEITGDPIDVQAVTESVFTEPSGAVVTFLGVVRREPGEETLRGLLYEAYPEMAAEMLEQVRQETLSRYPVQKVSIVHRTGFLKVAEISVAIAVSGPHRDEAFAACRYAIDRIKETVPIWKKEIRDDGERWVGDAPGNADAGM
jgi:molybdopterin synthase catalytic subunit